MHPEYQQQRWHSYLLYVGLIGITRESTCSFLKTKSLFLENGAKQLCS